MRTNAFVRITASRIVRVRKQAFELAAGEGNRQVRAALGGPLLEALAAFDPVAMFFFLPAEQRRAGRCGDDGEQKTRVGQNRRSFGQVAEAQFRGMLTDCRMRELLREPVSFDVVPRQLVDAVQERCESDERAAREHVCLQVRTQRVGDVTLERARRNHVARPGENGDGDQQRVMRLTIVLDHHRLAVRLGHVGERAVCIGMILLQMVECGVERGLIAVANDLGEQRIELRFPEAILDAAARGEERERQADQFVGVGGEAFGDSLAHIKYV